jgi:threonine dehydratase
LDDITSPPTAEKIHVRHVWEAKRRIAEIVQKTPLTYSDPLSETAGIPVYLKQEQLHPVHAFKIRGAANAILRLSDEERSRGITTFSTGNHGLAVAYVCRRLNIPAVICLSSRVPRAKTEALHRLGARLEIVGTSQDDAEIRCRQLEREDGLALVPPFDDPWVIAGQGTIGLELLEELPELRSVLVPLSGGGLLSGLALALKPNLPRVSIIGISMERSAVMLESLKAGKPVRLDESDTYADSLLGGLGTCNRWTFSLVRQWMDASIQVPEDAIAAGIAFLYRHHRIIAEGAAAVGIGAVLTGRLPELKGPVVIPVTGSNINPDRFTQAILSSSE